MRCASWIGARVDRVRSSTMMRMFDHVLFDFPTNPDPAAVGRKILALAKFTGHKSVGWLEPGADRYGMWGNQGSDVGADQEGLQ